MTLELEVYKAFCETSKFIINGIYADNNDFGEKYDRCPERAEPYGCGNMQFTRYLPKKEVLDKYGITTDEYEEICDKLETKLSFGCCGWCV